MSTKNRKERQKKFYLSSKPKPRKSKPFVDPSVKREWARCNIIKVRSIG